MARSRAGIRPPPRSPARDARRAEQATADRVAQVAETFFERCIKRNAGDNWAREGERLLRKEVIPALGSKRLGDVKKSDVHDMLDAIVDRGAPIVANRTLAIFRRLCHWAIERGTIAVSPCDKLKPPAAEKSRDRVLTDDEVRLAWGAFESLGWTFHDLRRTAASGMAGMGIAPHVVEAVLNHKSAPIKGVAAVYNRYSYASEKRAALDAWARRLDAIVSGQADDNVVAFARK